MEKQIHTVGERVDKLCAVCSEERGHTVSSVTKLGRISRVSCPKCGTHSSFKSNSKLTIGRPFVKAGAPYDWTRTYRTGQTMTHPVFGQGEVTAVIEPQKIDVPFADRMRRLIHSHVQA